MVVDQISTPFVRKFSPFVPNRSNPPSSTRVVLSLLNVIRESIFFFFSFLLLPRLSSLSSASVSHPERMVEGGGGLHEGNREYRRRRFQMLLRILPGRSAGPSFSSFPPKILPSIEKVAATFDGGLQWGKSRQQEGTAAMCHPSIGSDEGNLPRRTEYRNAVYLMPVISRIRRGPEQTASIFDATLSALSASIESYLICVHIEVGFLDSRGFANSISRLRASRTSWDVMTYLFHKRNPYWRNTKKPPYYHKRRKTPENNKKKSVFPNQFLLLFFWRWSITE